MIISFIRTLILYLTVIAALRFTGKRQIGELQPSELVVTIMISELASIPMEQVGTPIINGIIPILTLIAAEMFLSYITLKNRFARKLVSGKPSVIINKGVIDQKEMNKLRLNINDMMEELRTNGIFDISNVEYAILETNGQLSILQKSNKLPITASDLNIPVPYSRVAFNVIEDGELDKEALKNIGLSEDWLITKLKDNNINRINDVFIATVNANNDLFVQIKEHK